MAWALSAFFLLLKRNAIVPFVAGNLVFYANARQPVLRLFDTRKFLFVGEMFEVWLVVGQEIFV
jgi:hypothetical protein